MKEDKIQVNANEFKCFHCHKEDQYKKDCNKRKNKNKDTKEKNGNAAVASDIEESDGYGLVRVLIYIDGQSKGNWILNLGCFFCICPNKSLFMNYETYNSALVIVGNDTSCKVVGIGLIMLKMFDSTIRELRDVKHC